MKLEKTLTISILLIGLFSVFLITPSNVEAQTLQAKLGPVTCSSDADDPAIYIHPTDMSKSLFFGSDKRGEVCAWDFQGVEVDRIDFGTAYNNHHVIQNFKGKALLVANLRDASKLAVMEINPNWTSGNVLTVKADRNSSGNDIQDDSYGFGTYCRTSTECYVFDKPKKPSSETIKQWRLTETNGNYTTTQVRDLNGESIGVAEGHVGDDQMQHYYVAEEKTHDVFKFDANPNGGPNAIKIFGQNAPKGGDLEGMALYACNDGSGYLIGSNQGPNNFNIWDRQTNNFVLNFNASGASSTDGIDVSTHAAPGFPNGFLVIHDGGDGYAVYDWADLGLNICVNGGEGGSPSPTQPPQNTSVPPTNSPTVPLTERLCRDMDGDGICGLTEYSCVVTFFNVFNQQSGIPCDFNGDNFVDLLDHGVTVTEFGLEVPATNQTLPTSAIPTNPPPTSPPTGEGIAPLPNTKVAFIGDTGQGGNFQDVLNLIRDEGADIVLHQGDMSYENSFTDFRNMIDNTLGSSFPYFASAGNHDTQDNRWPGYASWLENRIPTYNNAILDHPEIDDEAYAVKYSGFNFVFSHDYDNSDQEPEAVAHITQQLTGSNYIWNICSWHQNQEEMQIGGKDDDIGWGPYDKCRELGALIATGHVHTYARSVTLTSMEHQTIDTTCADDPSTPNIDVCVGPNRSFVFDSSLGGKSRRSQQRCFPETPPYGCNGTWASIYTTDQNAEYGALFITFNVDGDPKKAKGYFKNIDGNVIDEFTVTKD